jgi:hypothetical protein
MGLCLQQSVRLVHWPIKMHAFERIELRKLTAKVGYGVPGGEQWCSL